MQLRMRQDIHGVRLFQKLLKLLPGISADSRQSHAVHIVAFLFKFFQIRSLSGHSQTHLSSGAPQLGAGHTFRPVQINNLTVGIQIIKLSFPV